MNKNLIIRNVFAFFLIAAMIFAGNVSAQTKKDSALILDCDIAKDEFIQTDNLMKQLFEGAHGYVLFPNIGKGAIGVGGATGNGILYQKGAIAGKASMTQVSVGFQLGGQAYREVIFFENDETIERFKTSKLEFSAQASAVAAKTGASATAKYAGGVMIFTQQKGGLMYEASVGGQKFKFKPF